MFTVLHDASHHAVSRMGWLNSLLGRASIPFLVPYAGFSLFRYIHIEHHRTTNEAQPRHPGGGVAAGAPRCCPRNARDTLLVPPRRARRWRRRRALGSQALDLGDLLRLQLRRAQRTLGSLAQRPRHRPRS